MEEVPSERQAACLYCVGDGALAQAAQRGGGVSSLEIFRGYLDVVLRTLLWAALLEQGFGPGGFQRSPLTSTIL